MNKKLVRKLGTSYQNLKRNRHIFATSLKLGDAEYRLFDLLSALSGWDKKYSDSFMLVEATDEDLAGILNWSDSKVCRTRNSLKAKGVIKKIEDSIHMILVLEEVASNTASVQEKVAGLQDKTALVKQEDADLQENRAENNNSSLVSSSGNSVIRTDKEYQEILDSGQFPTMTIEDMKWIDENVKE